MILRTTVIGVSYEGIQMAPLIRVERMNKSSGVAYQYCAR